MDERKFIFIPGNTPSSKNSKFWTGKFLISNKTTQNFKENSTEFFMRNKRQFKKIFFGEDKPYYVGFYFVRDSHRRFDYTNIVQIIADQMVHYGWIEDDSADQFVPVFCGYSVDKSAPGVYIFKSPMSHLSIYDLEAVLGHFSGK